MARTPRADPRSMVHFRTRAWLAWHEWRGHFRYSDPDGPCIRHWYTCCLPDDYGLDVPPEKATEDDMDNCIEDAMPRWLRS